MFLVGGLPRPRCLPFKGLMDKRIHRTWHASLSSRVNALKDQPETRREEKGNTVMVRFRG